MIELFYPLEFTTTSIPLSQLSQFSQLCDQATGGCKRLQHKSASPSQPLIPIELWLEEDKTYILQAELPGVDKFDISLSIDDGNKLTIDALKRSPLSYSNENSTVQPSLPSSVDHDVSNKSSSNEGFEELSKTTEKSKTAVKREVALHERYFGRFKRTIPLPKDCNFAASQASFENGVLTIKFAKTEPAKINITIN